MIARRDPREVLDRYAVVDRAAVAYIARLVYGDHLARLKATRLQRALVRDRLTASIARHAALREVPR